MRILILLFLCVGLIHAEGEIKKPFFDPFRKLIEPPKPPPKPIQQVVARPVPQKPVIPPLDIKIMGITGEPGARVAIVSYKGSQMLLLDGDDKPDFRVMSIDGDKLVVLHKAAQRRQEVGF